MSRRYRRIDNRNKWSGKEDIKNQLYFCRFCHRRELEDIIKKAKFDYYCPGCGQTLFSDFYKYGSDTHKEEWNKYCLELEILKKKGVVNDNDRSYTPVPFPDVSCL